MAFQFPWTNFHELNLDWFLSKFKQFTDNYLGTTATAESVPYGTQPTVTVTGGELDDDTDIVDPFTFNFKIPAGQQGEQGEQGIPGQDGFSPIATVTKTGTVATITITDANGTTSTTISDGEVTQAQLDTKAPVITETTESSAIANFTDGADDMVMHHVVAEINPVQDLSNGDPSPSNICPISGHTQATVMRTGKNLCSSAIGRYAWVSGTRYVHSSTAYCATENIIPIAGGTTFVLSLINTAQTASVTFCWFKGETWLNNTVKYSPPYSTTSPQDADGVAINFYNSSAYTGDPTVSNVQLELGSTATAYEPYQSTILTVDWTTEAGTVYGGTVDLATGLLTVTHVLWSKNTSTMDNVGGGTYPGWSNAGIRDLVGAGLNTTYTSQVLNIGSVFGVNTTLTRDVFMLPASAYSGRTMDDWVALAIDVQCVIPLATPQTYQLTPQEVKTLLGTNNVWADTGNVSVTYPADTKMFIEKLTIPTEDDLVANQAITSGKYFMIGNSLYLALANIASGAQITIGTNAQRVSLADALNTINS